MNPMRQWISVLALSCGAFIFNTTEFIPIALLSDIGRTFAISPTQTGVMITVYAWVVALTSLPLMLLTRQVERRLLLLCLLALFVVGHGITIWATSFTILLLGRVLVAFTHAIFWSITAALAVRVAPDGEGSRALSLMSLGSVLAMVLGLPLGRFLGGLYGWRITMMMIAVSAVLIALILAKTLPLLPSKNSGSLKSVGLIVKRKSLMMLLMFTVLIVVAHFTAYSYIEPFVRDVAAFSEHHITALLTVYGFAGFLGSYWFGKWFDKHSRAVFLIACAVLAMCMLLLLPLANSQLAIFALNVLWGSAFMAMCLAMVSRVLHFASDATDVANAIYSALFNVGIGGGALLGKYLENQVGLPNLGMAGGVLALLALMLAWRLAKQTDFVNQTMPSAS